MTTPQRLSGPADADNFRTSVGRARYYIDPLEPDADWPATDAAWPAVSAVKKVTSKDWTWTSYARVATAMTDPRVIAGLDGCNAEEIHSRFMAINRRGMGEAAERGTNVHSYCERLLLGEDVKPWLPGEPGAEYLPAVRAFFDAYQPELVATELVCIDRELNGAGYGGTGDAIVTISRPLPGFPDGGTFWIDWKTRGAASKHGAYAEEAAQIAAYDSAQYCLAADAIGTVVRRDLPETDAGLVVSIRPDGARVYPIDLDKATTYWESMHAFWVAQHTDKGVGRQWPPAPGSSVDAIAAAIAAAVDTGALRGLYRGHRIAWTSEHTALAKAKSEELGA